MEIYYKYRVGGKPSFGEVYKWRKKVLEDLFCEDSKKYEKNDFLRKIKGIGIPIHRRQRESLPFPRKQNNKALYLAPK